jgi:hypothetical protein
MNTITIDELEQKGARRLTRGEIMKSDSEISNRAPILRPSDVVHNRAPGWESDESDEPLHVDLPTARIGELAVCLHFSPGATCLITESFDGSIPTKGIVLASVNGNQFVDREYLKCWMLSGVLKVELERLQIGSHMATVKMSDLKQVRVPSPDISTQKQLIKAVADARESVEILSDLAHQSNRLLSLQNDLLIANLNQMNQQ